MAPPPVQPRRLMSAAVARSVRSARGVRPVRMPQAARLAVQSSVVFGAATLGLVVLVHRVLKSLQGASQQKAVTPHAHHHHHYSPTTFDESLVAFQSFMLSGT